jgi:hypothetical protein
LLSRASAPSLLAELVDEATGSEEVTEMLKVAKSIGASRRATGSLSEFPLVLIILLVIIAVPFVNLIGIACGEAAGMLIVRQTARAAATQPQFNASLSAMQQQANQQLSSGFARLVNMVPVGGYQGCGVDLYIMSTGINNGKAVVYGRDEPVPPPIDQTNNIYECSTRAFFDVGPILNMRGVPWLGGVPGLGKPVRLGFRSDRAAEYPTGLTGNPNAAISDANPPGFNSVPSSNSVNGGTNGSGWRNPQIYQEIANAGETIVQENVVIVEAANPNWTSSGVTVQAGDQVWLDTQAQGTWLTDTLEDQSTLANLGGNIPAPASNAFGILNTTDANGSPTMLYKGLPMGALVGQMGSGNPFLLGIQQTNLAPPGSGPLNLAANSDFNNYCNSGAVTVRIIVTQ